MDKLADRILAHCDKWAQKSEYQLCLDVSFELETWLRENKEAVIKGLLESAKSG